MPAAGITDDIPHNSILNIILKLALSHEATQGENPGGTD